MNETHKGINYDLAKAEADKVDEEISQNRFTIINAKQCPPIISDDRWALLFILIIYPSHRRHHPGTWFDRRMGARFRHCAVLLRASTPVQIRR